MLSVGCGVMEWRGVSRQMTECSSVRGFSRLSVVSEQREPLLPEEELLQSEEDEEAWGSCDAADPLHFPEALVTLQRFL